MAAVPVVVAAADAADAAQSEAQRIRKDRSWALAFHQNSFAGDRTPDAESTMRQEWRKTAASLDETADHTQQDLHLTTKWAAADCTTVRLWKPVEHAVAAVAAADEEDEVTAVVRAVDRLQHAAAAVVADVVAVVGEAGARTLLHSPAAHKLWFPGNHTAAVAAVVAAAVGADCSRIAAELKWAADRAAGSASTHYSLNDQEAVDLVVAVVPVLGLDYYILPDSFDHHAADEVQDSRNCSTNCFAH